MHTLDLDEHKEQGRENVRRSISKSFVWMTLGIYTKREYRGCRSNQITAKVIYMVLIYFIF